MWGGREGCEVDAAMDTRAALDRYAEAVNLACEYVASNRATRCAFALEPKPNEPRGDILLPTVGHMLAFIDELEHPEMVGLNPEFAHETMSGLSFHHAVAQTLWHGKLFHIDLNAQRPGKYDQDFRFGSEGIRDAFYLVKLLEDAGYSGVRHFDAHPYRTEDADGVWDFARGCIRTYLILRDKARRFNEDPEIQAALGHREGGRALGADSARGRDRRPPGGPARSCRPRTTGPRVGTPRPVGQRAAARRSLILLTQGGWCVRSRPASEPTASPCARTSWDRRR